MKSNINFGIFTLLLCFFLGACSAKKEATVSKAEEVPTIYPAPLIKGGDEARALPKATIFKMNGDYADKVAITLNPDGSLAYYPAPSDITEYTKPYALGNGWYLNRQGLSPNSVFTEYTFDEYKSLKKPPTHQQLKDAVIPGSSVTEFVVLPLNQSEAVANPEICLKYID